MKRIIVIFHLYYEDQLDYFIDRLSNIHGVNWDLLVTGNSISEDSQRALRTLKPDVRFLETENVGYDVWPFIEAVKNIDLDAYDIVIKLHTKNSTGDEIFKVNGLPMKDYEWREELVGSILRSKEQFSEVMSLFDSHTDAGMVCSARLLTVMHAPEDCDPLEREYARLNLKVVDRRFCAGTMFAVRADLLKVVADSDVSADMFPSKCSSHSGGTLAHVYERIFSMLVSSQGYGIYTVDKSFLLYFMLFYKRYIQPVGFWLFGLDREGERRVKTLTLFGMKFRLDDGEV